MRPRPRGLVILLALALLRPGLAAAQKTDKDDKKFLDDVRPILLADEEKMYKGLKDKSDEVDRRAAAKIIHPNIDYRLGKDGHLVKLADLLPKDTPSRALLKQPRQDFLVAAQAAPVAKAPANPIETTVGGSVIGPIPLQKVEPGRYVVQLKVTDRLGKKDLVQEVPFEIQP